MATIKKIAVFTSGGDAPGMNACIRAVVRTALHFGYEVAGIKQGYQGMIDNNIVNMDRHSVSNIMQLGGTILKTARCLAFKTPEGMQQAYDHLKLNGIDALVAIGGDVVRIAKNGWQAHALDDILKLPNLPGEGRGVDALRELDRLLPVLDSPLRGGELGGVGRVGDGGLVVGFVGCLPLPLARR